MEIPLPEKLPTTASRDMNIFTYADLLLSVVTQHNQLIDYLQEREELTPPTPPKTEWKDGDRYFFIDSTGNVFDSVWDNHSIDRARRDFLGIYRTQEEAEAVMVKIEAVVNK